MIGEEGDRSVERGEETESGRRERRKREESWRGMLGRKRSRRCGWR